MAIHIYAIKFMFYWAYMKADQTFSFGRKPGDSFPIPQKVFAKQASLPLF